MSTILRIYEPFECDEFGVPLDWNRCRTCKSEGTVLRNYGHTAFDGSDTRPKQGMRVEVCPTCAGMGSLRKAVLVHYYWPKHDPLGNRARSEPVRCENVKCRHPMAEGEWVGTKPSRTLPAYLAAVDRWLRDGAEDGPEGDPRWAWVNFTPCDDQCEHGGMGRIGYHQPQVFDGCIRWTEQQIATDPWDGAEAVEASWRQVDVRPLGWAHDLRSERLAVLCERCWAT